MSELLTIDHLTVRYRQPGLGFLDAVRDVTLAVQPGELVGIVGESGCGKSTLAKAICGLEPAAEGEIKFRGMVVPRLTHRARPRELQRIQMVFQNPYASLNPRRTIADQLSDGLRIAADPDEWTITELLVAVELDPSVAQRHPQALSGGQRQRVAIARAIATGPHLLIGDEPIASLDASLQSRIATLMKRLAVRANASLLFISHDLAIVRQVADRVVVMKDGGIVESGPVERVWHQPESPYTQRLLASIPRVDGLGTLPG